MSSATSPLTKYLNARRFGEASVGFTNGAAVCWIVLPGKPTFYAHDNCLPTRNETSSRRPIECPVCLGTPEDPYTITCGHTYCKQCFVEQCANHSTEFPVRCLRYYGGIGACGKPLSRIDLQQVLPSDVLEKLFEASFRQYIRSLPAKFRYCPLPACSRLNILERSPHTTATTGSTTTIICDGCKTPFCLSCNGPAHPSRTCKQAGNNASLDEWKRKNIAKDCPNCGVTTIKNYGCNHMQCAACMIHFCWLCRTSFKDTVTTCKHLEQVHGDWGIEDPPELPTPPEILVRVAQRCHVSYIALLDRWDEAVQQPPRAPHYNTDDAAKAQSEPTPRGRTVQPQALSDSEHADFAFHYLLRYGSAELLSHALNFDNARFTFIKWVRNISNFIQHHPESATLALLNNINRVGDIEEILHTHIGDGVGAQLRVTLDRFYENGFCEALFKKLLDEGRQMVAANLIEQVIADLTIAEWGGGEAENLRTAIGRPRLW